ncbi:DUF4238 domain-containing protein [Stenotrophomonas sp. TWI1183]|uniref:DUF4238 domain-containing protein n=1 Tax=Stenotrophomonas sp. TWI1183 TaxID=3136799 RepID=UPI0032096D08
MSIRQHWVPQFYLRGFATSPKGKTTWITELKDVYAGGYKASKESVKKVAYLEHLYSLPGAGGAFQPGKPAGKGWDDGVDKALQALEAEAGHVWKEITGLKRNLDLSPGSEARRTVARFLASMHLRNPRMAAVAKFAMTNKLVTDEQDLEQFYKAVASVPVDLSATTEGMIDRIPFIAVQLSELNEISSILTDMHWTVQYFSGNQAAGPLVTSDTPVFFVDRETMEPTLLDSADCAVYFPLSSRALLIATRARTCSANGEISAGTLQGADAINPFIVHYGQEQAYSGFELTKNFPFLR